MLINRWAPIVVYGGHVYLVVNDPDCQAGGRGFNSHSGQTFVTTQSFVTYLGKSHLSILCINLQKSMYVLTSVV